MQMIWASLFLRRNSISIFYHQAMHLHWHDEVRGLILQHKEVEFPLLL